MQQKTSARAAAAFLFTLFLSACSALNPAGILAASRLDPLGTAPDRIALAIGLPQTVRLQTGDAVLRIAFTADDAGASPMIEQSVPLQIRPADDTAPAPQASDQTVYLATVSRRDATRFAAAQAAIRNARARGVDGTGSLSVEVIGGCVTDPPLAALPVSTWIRTEPDAPFVALTRDVELFGMLDRAQSAQLRERLKPCAP
jgi:hypothetical protein